MKVEYLNLAQTNINLSKLGLGCMGMSEFYGPSNDVNSINVLEHALEMGVNFYDTADMYGHGHNEELLAQLLKGKRNRIVVATKFGLVRKEIGVYERTIDNSPEYIRSACEASLKRLGIDYIDLYYAHRLNPDHSLELMMTELAELVKEGKIRAIGLCEVSVEQLKRAHKIHPVAAVQTEYSLWTRDIESNGILETCRELGITLVPYSPLGRGLLAGAITTTDNLDKNDFRLKSPRFQGENLNRNLVLANAVKTLAEKKNSSPAQVALSWVLGKSDNIIPIPGTRRIQYLEDNLGALTLSLSPEDIIFLEDIFTTEAVAGARYPTEGMKGLLK
jgi:aryl-alcohol dehydrogenase-like predicted oxidoreductase